MTAALSAVNADVQSIAAVDGFGIVVPSADGRALLHTRSSWGSAAYALPSAQLPAPLRTNPRRSEQLLGLGAELDAPDSIWPLFTQYSLGRLVIAPLPDGSVFWSVSREESSLTDEQLDAFWLLGRKALEHAQLDETNDAAANRLRRMDALEEVVPALAGVLDVRGVFERLAKIVDKVIPHDALGLAILSDDRREAQAYASVGLKAMDIPQVITPPRHVQITPDWLYFLNEEMLELRDEGNAAAARAGCRSSLRLPVRHRDRLIGGFDIISFQPGRYRESDASVALRIAEHVALALSHQRLVAENQRAAQLRERAETLAMLDGLLDTLTDILDIRDAFDRISEVVQPVLPHDLLGVMEISDSGDRIRVLALAGKAGLPRDFEAPVLEPDYFTKPWDAKIIDDIASHPFFSRGPASKAGMQSVLAVPVRFGGRLRASVNFFSLEKAHFTRDDVFLAQRIASQIALAMSHHRLAEEARQRQALEEHASRLELLDQSLASLADTGQLKDLIHPISRVVQQVLPHDGLSVAVFLPDGRHARRYVCTGEDVLPLPELMEIPPDFHRAAELKHDIVEDLTTRPEPLNVMIAKAGFLSVLRIPIFLNGKFVAGVAFLSRSRSTYSLHDVPAGRRIADRLALSLEREHVVEAAKRADEADARAARLDSRVRQLTEELDARTGYRRIIGESLQWREVLKQAAQVAPVETTVLLLGESGTGKEVIARLVHRASTRRDGPFVALNCAALPDNLLESELFGYERGAFTGAMQAKPGLIEQASGGVLFLDEVGEMALPAQAKFLRVLQEREFQRLGGTRVLKADVRVVAATNRDLRRAIEQHLFREDLFFRLNVFEIRLPPLRERLGDILPLSEAFLHEIGRSIGRPPAGISREAKQALGQYSWPGNVRELRNVLERAAILADGGLIVAEHLALGPNVRTPAPVAPVPAPAGVPTSTSPVGPAEDLQSMERAMIEKALQQARFNKSIAAKALGLTRAQLYTRLKRYGME